jgi:hypothetical protein
MEKNAIRVLLVESEPRFARMLRESLSGLTGSRIDLTFSQTLADALTKKTLSITPQTASARRKV